MPPIVRTAVAANAAVVDNAAAAAAARAESDERILKLRQKIARLCQEKEEARQKKKMNDMRCKGGRWKVLAAARKRNKSKYKAEREAMKARREARVIVVSSDESDTDVIVID